MKKCDIPKILLEFIKENSGKYSLFEIRNILMGGDEYKDNKALSSYFHILPANISIYKVINDSVKDSISNKELNNLCIIKF